MLLSSHTPLHHSLFYSFFYIDIKYPLQSYRYGVKTSFHAHSIFDKSYVIHWSIKISIMIDILDG
jgi:hypothetical protein